MRVTIDNMDNTVSVIVPVLITVVWELRIRSKTVRDVHVLLMQCC